MIDYKLIGSRIRKVRKDIGLTQTKIAEILDVSPEYFSRIECGKTKINLEMLCRISEILKTPPEFLLTGCATNSPQYLTNEISDILQKCSPSKIQAITQIIKTIAEL